MSRHSRRTECDHYLCASLTCLFVDNLVFNGRFSLLSLEAHHGWYWWNQSRFDFTTERLLLVNGEPFGLKKHLGQLRSLTRCMSGKMPSPLCPASAQSESCLWMSQASAFILRERERERGRRESNRFYQIFLSVERIEGYLCTLRRVLQFKLHPKPWQKAVFVLQVLRVCILFLANGRDFFGFEIPIFF